MMRYVPFLSQMHIRIYQAILKQCKYNTLRSEVSTIHPTSW